MRKATLCIWSCAFLCLCTACMIYPHLSDEIALHWDMGGNVNGYGNRLFLFLIPLAMIGLDMVFLLFRKIDPKHCQYVRFEKVFQIFKVLNACLALLTFLLLCMQNLYPHHFHVGRILTIALTLITLIIGNYMPKVRPNFFIGIRTPWTLASEAIWQRTHWFSGRAFVCCAIFMMACCALPHPWMYYSFIFFIFLLVGKPISYSYIVFRKCEHKGEQS